jgi:hypothetical protein
MDLRAHAAAVPLPVPPTADDADDDTASDSPPSSPTRLKVLFPEFKIAKMVDVTLNRDRADAVRDRAASKVTAKRELKYPLDRYALFPLNKTGGKATTELDGDEVLSVQGVKRTDSLVFAKARR